MPSISFPPHCLPVSDSSQNQGTQVEQKSFFELTAGYTAPALQLLVIRQPKAVSRIAEAP